MLEEKKQAAAAEERKQQQAEARRLEEDKYAVDKEQEREARNSAVISRQCTVRKTNAQMEEKLRPRAEEPH